MIALLQKENPSLSKNSFHWAIGGMLRSGELVRSGYNSFCRTDNSLKHIYLPAYSEGSIQLIEKVKQAYPYVQFTVFETALLNEFLNHLVAKNTIFLQVEKDAAMFVFRFLQEEKNQNVLYKPTKKEFSLYWKKEGIVITELISEAPVLDIVHCRLGHTAHGAEFIDGNIPFPAELQDTFFDCFANIHRYQTSGFSSPSKNAS